MLFQKKLPKQLWGEAVLYANYLKNRSPTKALDGKTPEEMISGKCPNLAKLQEFGSEIYVLDQSTGRDKLDPKSRPFIFTGFSDQSRAYRYFNSNTRQIGTSRNVIFLDDPAPTDQSIPIQLHEHATIEEVTNDPAPAEGENNTNDSPAPPPATPQIVTPSTPSQIPRLSRPSRVPPEKQVLNYRQLDNPATRTIPNWRSAHLAEEEDAPLLAQDLIALIGLVGIDGEPATIAEARTRPDWPNWEHAMKEEISTLESKGTYEKAILPDDRKAIDSKWVFKIKTNADGSINKYKARLVAKGFSQIPGIDFELTQAPSLRLESLRTVLSLAAFFNLELHGIDIKGAYLNGYLDKEIYMKQPPGFEDGSNHVLLLKKSLYGLKQSGRAWRMELNKALISAHFSRSNADPSIFTRLDGNNISIIAVHIDDMAIAASTPDLIERIKKEIASHFEITDLGELTQIVGLEIARDRGRRTLFLSQKQYVNKILLKLGLENANPASTPVDTHAKLVPMDATADPEIDPFNYQTAIGSLMYAALGTRPDISFAVQHLSQFSSRPSKAHWTAVKRVFRYLKGTPDTGLIFSASNEFLLKGFCDADWGANLADRRSVTGYLFLLGGPISWSSKKQPTVALSSMEAEYMAISHAAREAIWLRNLISELGLSIAEPTEINVDNQAAISFANDEAIHPRTKHIDIRHHFCRDKVTSGEIRTNYISTDENSADIFTKSLSAPRHTSLCQLVGMRAARGSVSVN